MLEFILFVLQVLREFNHVHPQDDEEGKEFSETRVYNFNRNTEIKNFLHLLTYLLAS